MRLIRSFALIAMAVSLTTGDFVAIGLICLGAVLIGIRIMMRWINSTTINQKYYKIEKPDRDQQKPKHPPY